MLHRGTGSDYPFSDPSIYSHPNIDKINFLTLASPDVLTYLTSAEPYGHLSPCDRPVHTTGGQIGKVGAIYRMMFTPATSAHQALVESHPREDARSQEYAWAIYVSRCAISFSNRVRTSVHHIYFKSLSYDLELLKATCREQSVRTGRQTQTRRSLLLRRDRNGRK